MALKTTSLLNTSLRIILPALYQYRMQISGELVVIFLCLIYYAMTTRRKAKAVQTSKRASSSSQQPTKATPSPNANQNVQQKKPENPELAEMLKRKQEIQSTIQQYNNPSSLAKYSKMQRQLTKLNKAIKQFLENNPNIQVPQNTSAKAEPQLKKDNSTQPKLVPPEYSQPSGKGVQQLWVKITFNVVIIAASLLLSTGRLPRADQFPLSLVSNNVGECSCFFVYVACKVILSW